MRKKNFRLLPVWLSKPGGFTLVEILLAAAILSVLIGICIYTLHAVHISFNLTLSNKNLQSEVRRNIGWIVKDVRQSVSWDIANNTPSPDYIKFRQVNGWDTLNNTFLLSDHYIEYTYNAADQKITRRTSDSDNQTIGEWTLNNVTGSPFATINSSGEIVPLNSGDLLTSKKLVVTISGQSSQPSLQEGYSLTEEVQIRNG